MPTVQQIINRFHKKYSSLKISKIFKLSNGYLVIAPKSNQDYDDPNYFVSSDLSKVEPFNMKNMNIFFKALATKPLWERG